MSHAKRPAALVIGESLIDIVPGAEGGVLEHPGGSPMNVAVGLGRLGRPTMLATWFGRDTHGELIERHLRQSDVELVPGSDAAERTPTAQVLFDANGSARYVFDLAWRMPAVPSDVQPRVVHTGSIGASLRPGADAVLDACRALRPTTIISYDPNARPQAIGPADGVRDLMESFVATADIVKASDEDLAWLYPDDDPARSAAAWLGRGPSLLVLTRGAHGVVAMSHEATATFAAPDVVTVDTVGAGDAFMAALLDGLWSMGLLGPERRSELATMPKSRLGRLAAYASHAAGITLSRPGADPPWRDELPPIRD